jgi:hypothetical protein
MHTIGEDFKKLDKSRKQSKITLFHDKTANGKYDPIIRRQFNSTSTHPGFEYANLFTTVAPLKWQDCILLQPADLVAFEVFRQAQNFYEGRKNRKSYEALIALKTFGVHLRSFRSKEGMQRFRDRVKAGGSQFDFSSSL